MDDCSLALALKWMWIGIQLPVSIKATLLPVLELVTSFPILTTFLLQ